ncbi:MAG: phytanoyl-CoA dioxygenase family protein [Pseudomonadota bacterium]
MTRQAAGNLDNAQVERFLQDGFLTPLRVFSATEARAMRREFEAFEAREGEHAAGRRTDLHLLQEWAWRAVTDARVIDPVVSLIGPDVLLWSLNWFIKEPHTPDFVSMHQDANYWGLQPHDVITAWIALSDAGEATGPMRFVAGSHRETLYEHDNTYAGDNLLSRGQTIKRAVQRDETVLAPLAAGEMSLHHVRIVHGSGPNTTADRRIGMVLRFCGTHVQQTKGSDTAVLVAGEDRYGHFDLLGAPEADFAPEAQARHHDAVAKMGRIIMAD